MCCDMAQVEVNFFASDSLVQVQSVSDGSVSLVAQRDIAAGEDITLCYTNPFHGE